jgi:hypothetical protein
MPSDAMSGLYPIIRRQRRPLIVEESVPDGQTAPPIPPKTEPVQPVATVPLVEPADKPKADDAKSISTRKAR